MDSIFYIVYNMDMQNCCCISQASGHTDIKIVLIEKDEESIRKSLTTYLKDNIRI